MFYCISSMEKLVWKLWGCNEIGVLAMELLIFNTDSFCEPSWGIVAVCLVFPFWEILFYWSFQKNLFAGYFLVLSLEHPHSSREDLVDSACPLYITRLSSHWLLPSSLAPISSPFTQSVRSSWISLTQAFVSFLPMKLQNLGIR
jgi:hypothetical protein